MKLFFLTILLCPLIGIAQIAPPLSSRPTGKQVRDYVAYAAYQIKIVTDALAKSTTNLQKSLLDSIKKLNVRNAILEDRIVNLTDTINILKVTPSNDFYIDSKNNLFIPKLQTLEYRLRKIELEQAPQ